ncbi:MAG TPA: hypothetical protein VFX70_07990 [Mycobacteriales bacterium]|nr:hypothetical protein [Mycobacteriales bacterium]
MAAVAEDGLSVLLSSHVVAELERICDHLVVLTHGRVQVAGGVEDLLSTHHVFTGPTRGAAASCSRRCWPARRSGGSGAGGPDQRVTGDRPGTRPAGPGESPAGPSPAVRGSARCR